MDAITRANELEMANRQESARRQQLGGSRSLRGPLMAGNYGAIREGWRGRIGDEDTIGVGETPPPIGTTFTQPEAAPERPAGVDPTQVNPPTPASTARDLGFVPPGTGGAPSAPTITPPPPTPTQPSAFVDPANPPPGSLRPPSIRPTPAPGVGMQGVAPGDRGMFRGTTPPGTVQPPAQTTFAPRAPSIPAPPPVPPPQGGFTPAPSGAGMGGYTPRSTGGYTPAPGGTGNSILDWLGYQDFTGIR